LPAKLAHLVYRYSEEPRPKQLRRPQLVEPNVGLQQRLLEDILHFETIASERAKILTKNRQVRANQIKEELTFAALDSPHDRAFIRCLLGFFVTNGVRYPLARATMSCCIPGRMGYRRLLKLRHDLPRLNARDTNLLDAAGVARRGFFFQAVGNFDRKFA
jgi:hypothetical protein